MTSHSACRHVIRGSNQACTERLVPGRDTCGLMLACLFADFPCSPSRGGNIRFQGKSRFDVLVTLLDLHA